MLPPRAASSGGAALSTDTKVALVTGGLVAVAVALGVLTYLYWRHTRPRRYLPALGALDAITQVGSAPVTAATDGPPPAPERKAGEGAGAIFERDRREEPPPTVTAEGIFGADAGRSGDPESPMGGVDLWSDRPEEQRR
jgi:hypothetical protein